LLGQQYWENKTYHEYFNSHFVMFRADRTQKSGAETFTKFNIMATPTVLLLDPDGSEVDWHVGYDPPAEKFHEQLDKSFRGIDTYKYYAGLYANNPKDVKTVFNLAKKYDSRYNQEKAIAFYKEAIALDPEGKLGTTEYGKSKVPNTQYAEFQIGSMSLFGMKVDVSPMKAFLAKYHDGQLVKAGYQRLASYYSRGGTKEEAAKFLDEAVAKYPDDPSVNGAYVRKVISTKENVDKGIERSEHINDLAMNNPDPSNVKDLAELYTLKGQLAKADSVYGKEFIDGKVSMFVRNILQYATFWSTRNMNTESALAMADLVVKLKPDENYYLRQSAQIFCALKRPEKAMEVYGPKYADKYAADANKLMTYANFWAQQEKNLDGALVAAKKSTELSASNAQCWNATALVYQKMKKLDEAIKMLEKAVEVASDNQKSFYKNKLEVLKKEAGTI
jgi:tetratricopeptide (TPR) repeat protein